MATQRHEAIDSKRKGHARASRRRHSAYDTRAGCEFRSSRSAWRSGQLRGTGQRAARAGIRQGNVIVAFNGEPVTDGNTLRNRVASTPPGTKVKLTIFHDQREQQLEVTLGEYAPAKGSR